MRARSNIFDQKEKKELNSIWALPIICKRVTFLAVRNKVHRQTIEKRIKDFLFFFAPFFYRPTKNVQSPTS